MLSAASIRFPEPHIGSQPTKEPSEAVIFSAAAARSCQVLIVAGSIPAFSMPLIVVHHLCCTICRQCKQFSVLILPMLIKYRQIIIFFKGIIFFYILIDVCNQIFFRKISGFICIQKCHVRSFLSCNPCLQFS